MSEVSLEPVLAVTLLVSQGPGLLTHSSLPHAHLPKEPVDKYAGYTFEIFKAHTHHLKIKIIQCKLFWISPYFIDPNKKTMLVLNLFILHNCMTA